MLEMRARNSNFCRATQALSPDRSAAMLGVRSGVGFSGQGATQHQDGIRSEYNMTIKKITTALLLLTLAVPAFAKDKTRKTGTPASNTSEPAKSSSSDSKSTSSTTGTNSGTSTPKDTGSTPAPKSSEPAKSSNSSSMSSVKAAAYKAAGEKAMEEAAISKTEARTKLVESIEKSEQAVSAYKKAAKKAEEAEAHDRAAGNALSPTDLRPGDAVYELRDFHKAYAQSEALMEKGDELSKEADQLEAESEALEAGKKQ